VFVACEKFIADRNLFLMAQHPFGFTFGADCSTKTPESSTEVPGRCSMPACRTREERDKQAYKN